MKLHNGAWLPDDEADQVMLAAGRKYQNGKLLAAMRYVNNTRLAIDIGAHCGLWSMQLMELFDHVVAFEPLFDHIQCFKKNADGCELHEVALGDRNGTCGIKIIKTLSGRSHIEGDGDITLAKLDNFGLSDIGLIKIDCEGYELFVLRGGIETIQRSKPVIIVEQKTSHGCRYGINDTEAVTYLESIGYKKQLEIIGDYIMTYGCEH